MPTLKRKNLTVEQPDKVTPPLTLEYLKQVSPTNIRRVLNQGHVDKLNAVIQDSEIREELRENLVGYMGILKGSMFRLQDYINAVMYVSYKLMGDSNIAAWSKVFPERLQRLLDNNATEKQISGFVAMYNRNKLVNLIVEQSLVPSYILNQDLYQKALNVQAELMMNARSEKVRCDAANSLLNQLKQPETQKVEVDMTVKEDESINELRKTTLELVNQQRKLIEKGHMRAREIAESKVIGEASYQRIDE